MRLSELRTLTLPSAWSGLIKPHRVGEFVTHTKSGRVGEVIDSNDDKASVRWNEDATVSDVPHADLKKTDRLASGKVAEEVLGKRVKFDSLYQFKGYLTGQWGRPKKELNSPSAGITGWWKNGKVVAEWDNFSHTGFVHANPAQSTVNEDALETVKAEDLWADHKDEAAEYRALATYLVRQLPDTTPAKFEAFQVIGDKRTPYGKYSQAELQKVLRPIRAGQKPDVEGFTTYVDLDTVDAFQYEGDPIKVLLGAIGRRLNNGDYVIRSNDGNDFEYTVDSASNFESTLQKV